jgi:rfaE bifunctional protein kinase chain/domain
MDFDEIKEWNNQKVLIIGESLVDKYIFGYADRISPDAPVPNIKMEETETYIGAVGLVLKFIKSLGGIPEICTILGNDYEGNFFYKKIEELNLDLSGIIIDDSINTPQVTRIKAMNQHLLRLETDYKQNISSETIEQFYKNLESRGKDLGAIIILDYGIGELFEDKFIQNLLNRIKNNYPDVPILARPNLDNYYLYENIDLIRMNLLKALHTLSIDCCTDTSVSIVGKRILNTSKCKNVLLNHIESESYLFHQHKEKFDKYPSFLNTPIRSYVAVGSVIMAILGLSYAAGFPVEKAVHSALKGASLSAILPPIHFFNQNELLEYILGE